MSLHTLANHMATAGRGPDSMLVHMSPREVQALQTMAQKNGGSLTTNPHTGLPEAGFLDTLLPIAAGFALGPAGWGAMSAMGAAATVGGITALATGSLERGLMAGFGAYGGAGLGGSLQAMGAPALTEAEKQAAITAGSHTGMQEAGTEAAASTVAPAAGTGTGMLPPTGGATPFPAGTDYINLEAANVSLPQGVVPPMGAPPMPTLSPEGAWPTATGPNSASLGFERATASPEAFGKFAGDNKRYLASALVPGLLDVPKKGAVRAPSSPGMIRRFSYDPTGYTSLGNYAASEDKGMASGGIARLANGGAVAFAGGGINDLTSDPGWSKLEAADKISAFNKAGVTPEQLLAANQGVSQSDIDWMKTQGYTGVAPAAQTMAPAQAPDYASMVNQAYGNIGRTGIGANAGNIDQAGYDYWVDQLKTGAVSQADLNKSFGSSVNQYLTQTPDDAVSNYVQSHVVNKFAQPTGTSQEFMTGTQGLGLYGEPLANALKESEFSGGAQYALQHADIGDVGNASETYGGLKGLSSNINYWLAQHPEAKLTDLRSEMDQWQLNEADIVRATGKTSAELFKQKLEKATPGSIDPGVGGATGAGQVGGGTVVNPNGTITTSPVIPDMPVGGVTGMQQVKDIYTTGGGSTGYVPAAPKTAAEHEAAYNRMTGGSKQAFDYLTGKSPYSATPYTPTGEIQKPYMESVMGYPAAPSYTQKFLFDPQTRKYTPNPEFIPTSYTSKGEKVYGLPAKEILAALPDMPKTDYEKWMKDNNVTYDHIAQAMGISPAEARKRYPKSKTDENKAPDKPIETYNQGGMTQNYAGGGLGSLGGYSDGGQLLRGDGDGVSDSIPASIGGRQPARLADGEFVVPARIVSELGNGSTEAGARRLYQMMDRVQHARKKSIGKDKVATNSRADKYLPA